MFAPEKLLLEDPDVGVKITFLLPIAAFGTPGPGVLLL